MIVVVFFFAFQPPSIAVKSHVRDVAPGNFVFAVDRFVRNSIRELSTRARKTQRNSFGERSETSPVIARRNPF